MLYPHHRKQLIRLQTWSSGYQDACRSLPFKNNAFRLLTAEVISQWWSCLWIDELQIPSTALRCFETKIRCPVFRKKSCLISWLSFPSLWFVRTVFFFCSGWLVLAATFSKSGAARRGEILGGSSQWDGKKRFSFVVSIHKYTQVPEEVSFSSFNLESLHVGVPFLNRKGAVTIRRALWFKLCFGFLYFRVNSSMQSFASILSLVFFKVAGHF